MVFLTKENVMIVGGMPGLFPLEKLNRNWSKYYMNAGGQVFSVKTTTAPRLLNGSTSAQGRHYSLSPSNGFSPDTIRADALVRRAKTHVDFKKETVLTVEPKWPHDSPFNNLESEKVDAYRDQIGERNHAASVADGIKARGYLIGQVQGEAIVFGSKPKIHTTLKSVKSEIERLANKTPGLQLIYLKIEGSVRAASLVWE